MSCKLKEESHLYFGIFIVASEFSWNLSYPSFARSQKSVFSLSTFYPKMKACAFSKGTFRVSAKHLDESETIKCEHSECKQSVQHCFAMCCSASSYNLTDLLNL